MNVQFGTDTVKSSRVRKKTAHFAYTIAYKKIKTCDFKGMEHKECNSSFEVKLTQLGLTIFKIKGVLLKSVLRPKFAASWSESNAMSSFMDYHLKISIRDKFSKNSSTIAFNNVKLIFLYLKKCLKMGVNNMKQDSI